MEHKELTAANVRMPIIKAAAIWTEYSGGPAIQKATLVRWITEGVNGHRLKAERFGGRWFCTPADLADLHRRLNEQSFTADSLHTASRAAEVAAAERRLDEKLDQRDRGPGGDRRLRPPTD